MLSVAYVGLDVHKDSITVAVLAEAGDTLLDQATLPNEKQAVTKYFRRLSSHYSLRCCYEASGCGYVLHRWLTELGVACEVIAPSKIPVRTGDRVKTDRRDAKKLARLYRAGELTPVRIPSKEEESVRSLVRCREAMMEEVVASKHRVLKFLQTEGAVYSGKSNWTQKHRAWLKGLRLATTSQRVLSEYLALLEYKESRLTELDRELAALAQSELYRETVGKLCCLRGVGIQTAMVLVTETQDFRRFGSPRQLMSYYGLVPSESSSGGRTHHGGITKTGNGRCRRVLIEAAWHYQHPPAVGKALRKRQEGQSPEATVHAFKAQQRLHKKFWRLARKKERPKAIVAAARELVGFVWAIATDSTAA